MSMKTNRDLKKTWPTFYFFNLYDTFVSIRALKFNYPIFLILQEKEKELDEKNIYHYQITKQKKKGATLPALPAGPQAPAVSVPVIHAAKSADTQEKRTNVFLTNAPSDTGSVLTDEAERSFKAEVWQDKPTVSEAAKPIVLEANKGDKDDEDRRRGDAEERSKLDEEERRRRLEEEELKRREEEERTRREEEEKRKAVEERRRREEEEQLNKQREEEEERLRKQKEEEEEEERKRFEEDAEVRRKKDLLLARMRAIDTGSDKPDSGVTVGHTTDPAVNNKPKKLPIFLQSDQPEPQKAKPAPKSVASDDDVFSDIGGDRKKRSSAHSKHSSYSYDFKQTVENLHHGLPAHVSLENIKDQSAKVDGKDSLSDDISVGSYKPTLGRRAAAKRDSRGKDELSFGGYNPSFGAKKDMTRKNSGLDFGTGKKAIPHKEQNGVIFGDYKPMLGGAPTKTASTQQNGDIFGERNSPVRNRRTRGFASKNASVFGDDLFENDNPKPTGEPLFGDKSLKEDKSSYPWENKVDVTLRKNSEGDSLLPRRRVHLHQNVRAVNNALGDIDDEIEEVIL